MDLYDDEVLLLFAQLAEQTFRSDDLCFRFGGEKFIVVLKCIDIKLAMHVLERFRTMVEILLFHRRDESLSALGWSKFFPRNYRPALSSRPIRRCITPKEMGAIRYGVTRVWSR